MFRYWIFVMAAGLVCAQGAQVSSPANESATQPAPAREIPRTLNVINDRVAFRSDINSNYLEWFQVHETSNPKLAILLPDFGVVGFGSPEHYREIFVGTGIEYRPIKSMAIDNEFIFDQSSGPEAHGKNWYVGWTRIANTYSTKWASEVVFYPYLPFNGGATQFFLDRSKIEYTGFKHFNIGPGYSGRWSSATDVWQNRPYLSVTIKTRSHGRFEWWLQSLPNNNFQVYYRHTISWR